MTLPEVCATIDAEAMSREAFALVKELYPIPRSLTGDGVRETLRRVQKRVDLTVHEVPTGRPVLDWTVPEEWNLRDAYVADADGQRVIDAARTALHVVGYSVPVRARLSLAALRPHLHTLPEHPDWVPYRTSYYQRTWGFCLSHRQLMALPDEEYEVVIDASLGPGSMTYGELFVEGETTDEVLLSCHVCHPALANDNASGIALATLLGQTLAKIRPRYSHRILFVPGTIGSITWLALNAPAVARIRHGLVVACVGDPGPLTYKRSRRGDAEIDRAVAHVLRHAGLPHAIVDFSPYGYDERQYGSPGFDLPVGSLTRSSHGRYPEYHTSADDLTLVRPAALAESFRAYLGVLAVLDGNRAYRNTSPYGEPQLGRRGLYRATGGQARAPEAEMALLWVLNQSDGGRTLLDIAERAGLPFAAVRAAADRLLAHGLLEPVA